MCLYVRKYPSTYCVVKFGGLVNVVRVEVVRQREGKRGGEREREGVVISIFSPLASLPLSILLSRFISIFI